jgi:hypothetical protein
MAANESSDISPEGRLIIASNIVLASIMFEMLSVAKHGSGGQLAIPAEKQVLGKIKNAMKDVDSLIPTV